MNMGVKRFLRSQARPGNAALASLLLASGAAVAQQAPPARPPAQVRVPNFTPVAPQPYRAVSDAVSLSEVAVVTSQDCKEEQDAWVQAALDEARYHNRNNGNNYFHTNADEFYKYLENLYFKDGGAPRRRVSNGMSRNSLRENMEFYDERAGRNVPECAELNSCVEAKSLRSTRLERCLWKLALSRGGQPVRPSAAPPRPAPRVGTPLPPVQPAAPVPQDGFKRKLDQAGLKYEMMNGDYRLLFNVGGTKRTQLIYVSGGTQTIDGIVIREFFAPAAKVSTSVDGAKALEMLAESHKKKVGSWEIHGDLLMFTAKVPDAIDGADMRSMLDTVVNVADEMEIKLTGADVY